MTQVIAGTMEPISSAAKAESLSTLYVTAEAVRSRGSLDAGGGDGGVGVAEATSHRVTSSASPRTRQGWAISEGGEWPAKNRV